MSEQELFQLWVSEKHARVIIAMSELYDIAPEDAMRIYYNSETAQLINEGVADLHCRSSKYLAGEVWREYNEKE